MSEVTCSICGATEDANIAVNGGEWVPYFWDEVSGGEQGPACPVCVANLGLHFVMDGETGEYVKRDYAGGERV